MIDTSWSSIRVLFIIILSISWLVIFNTKDTEK